MLRWWNSYRDLQNRTYITVFMAVVCKVLAGFYFVRVIRGGFYLDARLVCLYGGVLRIVAFVRWQYVCSVLRSSTFVWFSLVSDSNRFSLFSLTHPVTHHDTQFLKRKSPKMSKSVCCLDIAPSLTHHIKAIQTKKANAQFCHRHFLEPCQSQMEHPRQEPLRKDEEWCALQQSSCHC